MTTLKRKKNRKNTRQKIINVYEIEEQHDQDEHFYMIIDYTGGGAAYGITWEEYYENIYEFNPDYYYISEILEDGKILGITWKDYLKKLDKEL